MGKVILLRHGESLWSEVNRFTGWTDVPLTEKGETDAKGAAGSIVTEGLEIEYACTSVLNRATETLRIILAEMKIHDLPQKRSFALNERHYGELQGLYKKDVIEKYGEEQVFLWRRSYDVYPPAVALFDSRHPVNDALYKDVPRSDLPGVETLMDVVARVMPFWRKYIAPEIRTGKTVLVVAHGNTVRALIKYLDTISDEEIAQYDIPYAIPLLYEFGEHMEVQNSRYLGDPDVIKETIAAIQKQGKID